MLRYRASGAIKIGWGWAKIDTAQVGLALPMATARGDHSRSMNSLYRRISLDQGTPEWLQWRHQGIGGSDASVIMGESRWKSRAQLLQEKINPPCEGVQNEAMAMGTALEPVARSLYCSTTGKSVQPACLQSAGFDWMRVSVDGISECGSHLVEIKCGQSVYRHAATHGTAPGYYLGQLQHSLLVTGLDAMDFWCYWPDCAPVHVVVSRDDNYIAKLARAEEEFWNEVCSSRLAASPASRS